MQSYVYTKVNKYFLFNTSKAIVNIKFKEDLKWDYKLNVLTH